MGHVGHPVTLQSDQARAPAGLAKRRARGILTTVRFAARRTDEDLHGWLTGSELAAVAREAPTGRVPDGAED